MSLFDLFLPCLVVKEIIQINLDKTELKKKIVHQMYEAAAAAAIKDKFLGSVLSKYHYKIVMPVSGGQAGISSDNLFFRRQFFLKKI